MLAISLQISWTKLRDPFLKMFVNKKEIIKKEKKWLTHSNLHLTLHRKCKACVNEGPFKNELEGIATYLAYSTLCSWHLQFKYLSDMRIENNVSPSLIFCIHGNINKEIQTTVIMFSTDYISVLLTCGKSYLVGVCVLGCVIRKKNILE